MGLLKARNSSQDVEAREFEEDSPRLDHPEPALRRRAVQALAGDPDNLGALMQVLRNDRDNHVRQAAFLALTDLNSSSAAREVASLLTEPDPALRNGALETLAAMPDHAAALLPELGTHKDPDVRIFAVLLTGELGGRDSTAWLINMAQQEQDPNVCSNLAEALGGLGRPEAIEALETIVVRFPEDPFLAFAVETAIQRLREV